MNIMRKMKSLDGIVGPAHLLARIWAQNMQQRRVEGIPIDFTSFERQIFEALD
jgi:hypothetical protein